MHLPTQFAPAARDTLLHTLASGVVSLALLAWRGRREIGSAAAPLNAPSQWIHGERALEQDAPSARYTLLGSLIHMVSAALWGGLYETIRRRRRRPTAVNAVTDAVVVTAVATAVDLVVTPKRFTPGFERRLSRRGTGLVYIGFAAALALTGIALTRRL